MISAPHVRTLVLATLVCSLAPSAARADGVPLVLRGPKREVSAIAVSLDGRFVAAGAEDGIVQVWDGAALVATHTPDAQSQGGVTALAFSIDGAQVLIGDAYGFVTLWDRVGNKDLYAKHDHVSRVTQIVVAPDGKSFVTASWDHTLRAWDTATGASKPSPKMGYQANGVAVGADGTTYAIDSHGDVAVSAKGKNSKIEIHQAEGRAIAISPSGAMLAIGYGDQSLYLVELATHKELRHLGVGNDVNSLAFTPDGKTLAIGTQGAELLLLDVTKPEPSPPLKGHDRSITSLAYSRDGRKLVTGSRDKTVRVWPMK